jgi:hypothetical protein
MMGRRTLLFALSALVAAAAMAQQRPIFDPDDFVDPRELAGKLFVSSLVIGGASNPTDDYRPLHQNVGFVHLTNSFSWSRFQFAYKHSEVRGKDNGPAELRRCHCIPPMYFPTPPLPDSTPAAPLPGATETLQFAFYLPGGFGSLPPMLRYRLSVSRQQVHAVIVDPPTSLAQKHPRSIELGNANPLPPDRLSGHEQSIGIEAETYLPIGRHRIFGSLFVARTSRSGTADDRAQTEIAYANRFPAVVWRKILMRPTLTVGAISGRGASGLNLVNPAFEAFWHDPKTRANLHLIWSPQAMRSGAEGWKTHHQIAFFVERALYVKLFRTRPAAPAVGESNAER